MVRGRERCLCCSIKLVVRRYVGIHSTHLELDRVRVTKAYSIQDT